jgi:hypothetical protein
MPGTTRKQPSCRLGSKTRYRCLETSSVTMHPLVLSKHSWALIIISLNKIQKFIRIPGRAIRLEGFRLLHISLFFIFIRILFLPAITSMSLALRNCMSWVFLFPQNGFQMRVVQTPSLFIPLAKSGTLIYILSERI